MNVCLWKNIAVGSCLYAFLMCAQANPVITATKDAPGVICKIGEKPGVTFSVKENGIPLKSGKALLHIDQDGGKVLLRKEVEFTEKNEGTVRVDAYTLDTPGFLRIMMEIKENGKTVCARVVSFPFEPEKIIQAEKCPEDFQAWWKSQLQQAEQIPLDEKVEKLDQFSNDKFTAYKISVATQGGRVWGFMTVPVGSGPFPVIIHVPGAGPGSDKPFPGKAGLIQVLLNVHNFDPIQPGKTINQSYDEEKKACRREYFYVNREDRNTFFFNRVITGFSKIIDYLSERKDVKKNAIGIHGFSQGGAMTLTMAGLNANVSYAVANMPAMCDLFSMDKDRGYSWPYMLAVYKREPGAEMTARYYDVANFSAGVRIPVEVFVGGIDNTSRPGTVYAAYNAIPSKDKKITLLENSTHCSGKEYNDAVAKMEEILKKR